MVMANKRSAEESRIAASKRKKTHSSAASQLLDRLDDLVIDPLPAGPVPGSRAVPCQRCLYHFTRWSVGKPTFVAPDANGENGRDFWCFNSDNASAKCRHCIRQNKPCFIASGGLAEAAVELQRLIALGDPNPEELDAAKMTAKKGLRLAYDDKTNRVDLAAPAAGALRDEHIATSLERIAVIGEHLVNLYEADLRFRAVVSRPSLPVVRPAAAPSSPVAAAAAAAVAKAVANSSKKKPVPRPPRASGSESNSGDEEFDDPMG